MREFRSIRQYREISQREPLTKTTGSNIVARKRCSEDQSAAVRRGIVSGCLSCLARRCRRSLVVLTAAFSFLCTSPSGKAQQSVEMEIPAQTVEIQHNRSDLTLAALWMKFRCLRRVRNQSVAPSSSRLAPCREFRVNGKIIDGDSTTIALNSYEADKIDFPSQLIQYSDADGAFLCIAMKVIFHGFSNKMDYQIYVNQRDRYSLLSYCTVDEQPADAPDRYPYSQNATSSWAEFIHRLSEPVRLDLVPASK